MPQQLNLNERKEDRLLTLSEVAKRLRLDDTTVRRWVTAGILEAVVLPHKGKRRAYRIKASTLEEIIQGGKKP